MKIFSLNLHCFQEEDRIEKLNKITNFIKERDIDVCLFQEACQERDKVLLEDLVRILKWIIKLK